MAQGACSATLVVLEHTHARAHTHTHRLAYTCEYIGCSGTHTCARAHPHTQTRIHMRIHWLFWNTHMRARTPTHTDSHTHANTRSHTHTHARTLAHTPNTHTPVSTSKPPSNTRLRSYRTHATCRAAKKKRAHDKEARMATVLAGREGRSFGSAAGMKKGKTGGVMGPRGMHGWYEVREGPRPA